MPVIKQGNDLLPYSIMDTRQFLLICFLGVPACINDEKHLSLGCFSRKSAPIVERINIKLTFKH